MSVDQDPITDARRIESEPTNHSSADRKIGTKVVALITAGAVVVGGSVAVAIMNLLPRNNAGNNAPNPGETPVATAPLTPGISPEATPAASSSPEIVRMHRPVFEESPLWKNLPEAKKDVFGDYITLSDKAYMNLSAGVRAQNSEFVYRVMKDYTDSIFMETQRGNYEPLVAASSNNSNQEILDQFDALQTSAYFLQAANGDAAHLGPESVNDTEGRSWRDVSKKVAAGLYTTSIPDYQSTMSELDNLTTLTPDCVRGDGCTNEYLATSDKVTGTANRRTITYTGTHDGRETKYSATFVLTTFAPLDAKPGSSQTSGIWQIESLSLAS